MEKEKLQNKEDSPLEDKKTSNAEDNENKVSAEKKNIEEKPLSPEEEIANLKDKVSRIFAEMENQRRRFEKEKDEAFEYGGFAFAKETLNLLDNLERSRLSLENDETIKNTEGLKKLKK